MKGRIVLVIEEYIIELTGQELCGSGVQKILSGTSHLVRASNIARGAAFCIYAARLAEAIGAVTDFVSIIPGRGRLTHQLLAVALPQIFYGPNGVDLIKGKLPYSTIESYVNNTYKDLVEAGIVNKEAIEEFEDKLVNESITYATKMIYSLSRVMPIFISRIGLNEGSLRLFTELFMYSYRFHVVGIIDAVIEDPISRKALVIEWKTGKTPENWEIAQAYTYALMEAERLGHEDPVGAVRDREDVVPIVIRPTGKITVYSIADTFRTADKTIDKYELIRNILLSAEHLVLTITEYTDYIDKNTAKICSIRGLHGQKISAFRRAPKDLPRSNPVKYGNKYPCRICRYKEACKFYMKTYEDWTLLDRIAYRARHAIYKIRENAQKPIKELYNLYTANNYNIERLIEAIIRLENTLGESGNRIDYFEKASLSEPYEIILERKVREYEKSTEPIKLKTLREGKPVLIIFNDPYVNNPLLRLSFHGRVEEIEIEPSRKGDKVYVHVAAPNIPSRLQLEILRRTTFRNREYLEKIIGVEINVDLTQLELQAIDAFHRGSRKVAELNILAKTAEKIRKKYRDAMFSVLFIEGLLKGENKTW